jgi:hypothetical protein
VGNLRELNREIEKYGFLDILVCGSFESEERIKSELNRQN